MTEHPVATFDPGDKEYNTIALPGRDVIIPLQEDLDCDPLQDDEIRLSSIDGDVEHVLSASDPDAVADHDKALIYYRFRNVLPGYYRISVRVGTQWMDVTTDLVVTARAAYLRGQKLAKEPPEITFDPRRIQPAPEAPSAPTRRPRYLDINDMYRDTV